MEVEDMKSLELEAELRLHDNKGKNEMWLEIWRKGKKEVVIQLKHIEDKPIMINGKEDPSRIRVIFEVASSPTTTLWKELIGSLRTDRIP